MQLTTCPSSEQLSDYLSGKLSAQEIDEISLHIETCVDCDTAVHKLDHDSDSLMFALRQPLGEELFEQEPELQRAVAAMRFSLPESESQNSCTVLGTVREYDLLEKIGQGGMGTVYKALHSRLKRIVALKVLADHRLGDPAAVDRFSREMQAVGKLAHPNIVRALDAGEAEGRHYLVMEYIDGIDLSRLSRRCGPLPVAEASELVLQVSLALQHAHEHGLVHRDIKPSNVMLTRDGNVKLLDLGIALLQPEEPATSDLTGTGQVMGTLDYMAPEQLDNTHAVDIRADIYGLGATLYKLLCGSARRPIRNHDSACRANRFRPSPTSARSAATFPNKSQQSSNGC
ncbi:serine/threonine-protein kinase [Symmachiella dynata]|uniref:serine/threonine-protein kinase n=1 Tax=Symmachiella dynata TaxID=2527995 RepID=UPI0030ECB9BD